MRSLRQIWKQYRLYILLGMAFVVIALTTYAVLIPQLGTISLAQANLTEKKTQLDRLQKKQQLLDSLDSTAVQTQAQEMEAALPFDKDIASILTSLETLSSTSQLSIETVSFNPGSVSSESATTQAAAPIEPQIRKGAFAIPVSVTAKGANEHLRAFLDLVSRSRRIFDLEELTLSYLPDSPDFVEATIVLQAYYLPADEILGAETLPIITTEEKNLLSQLLTFPVISRIQVEGGATAPEGLGKPDLFN